MNWRGWDWYFPKKRPTSLQKPQTTNPLAGKPLRYLIGADPPPDRGVDGEIIEVPWGEARVMRGISIGYCNLFDEENTGKYGPYLRDSDTAREYNEGQIDPSGPGWTRNLTEQFEQRKRQGFEYIELDNPDAYSIDDVIGAIELAATYGLKVIAKNPLLMESGDLQYLAHPNIYGAIVEREGGSPVCMHQLREDAGKPLLPVWYVYFGDGATRAKMDGNQIQDLGFLNMGVTYSPRGEYSSVEHIVRPHA